MSMEVKAFLVFGVLGVVFTATGWAAWTGRYRGWARRGLGYRVLIALPSGIGFLLFSLAAVVPPKPAGGVLFGLGALCFFFTFLYIVATIFVKDRWYPRWYHRLPPEERRW